MNAALVALLVSLCVAIGLVVFLLVYLANQKKIKRETQRDISDRDILKLINGKIDGIINAQELANETSLAKSEARTRLTALGSMGILRCSVYGLSNIHFELTRPLEERHIPALSPEPFLTAEDILKLFVAHDYRLDYQDLVMATGLPLEVLKREMKYFTKEKMVRPLSKTMGYGMHPYRFFILEEPYRSNPKKFIQNQESVDLKLKELLTNDQLI